MVARFNPCCTRAELRAVLAQPHADFGDPQLESHLEECAACRAELERLAAAPEWWQNAQSYLTDDGGFDESIREDIDTPQPHELCPPPAERAKLLSWLPSGLLQPSSDGEKFGRIGCYEVVEAIGRGGMGVVLKAFDPALNRYVAIKVLAAEFAHNASARRRFAREAQAAAAVVHDHVVPIYAVDGMGPNPYLVMAYIPGRSLQERIDETGPLEVREILRIGMQTAAGLAAAHAQGLVHRDIKPANILLENGVERVRITDFGLARAMDEASQTQSGVLAGTPQYMAPEQASGEAIDYRTDLFSLGSVLYAMCTGHSPFRAETTVAVLRRICDGTPRPVREVNPDIPHWLAAIISKLLSKRPNDRFGSAEEVARLLAEHLAQVQHPPRRSSSIRRQMTAWLAAIAAVVTVSLFAAWRVNLGDQPADTTDSSNAVPSAIDDSAGHAVKDSHAAVQPSLKSGDFASDIDAFDGELRALRAELSRLETTPYTGVGFRPYADSLPQLDQSLDALEKDLRLRP